MQFHQMIVLLVYVVLFAVFLTTSVIIGGVFVYFYWHKQLDSKKYSVTRVRFNPNTTHALIN